MIKKIECPKCDKGKLSMGKPCFSCNSTGSIDYPQALSQVEFWDSKIKDNDSDLNKANRDFWWKIAESLNEDRKEFENMNDVSNFLIDKYDGSDDVIEGIEMIKFLCEGEKISITITSEGKVIIDG